MPGHWSPTCSSVRAVGRKVEVDELVGVTEIVERLDLKIKEAVRSWRSRYPDFPAPVAQLALGPVWVWRDIERWALATGRPRGHRHKVT